MYQNHLEYLKMWTAQLLSLLSHSDIHSNRWKAMHFEKSPSDSDVYVKGIQFNTLIWAPTFSSL